MIYEWVTHLKKVLKIIFWHATLHFIFFSFWAFLCHSSRSDFFHPFSLFSSHKMSPIFRLRILQIIWHQNMHALGVVGISASFLATFIASVWLLFLPPQNSVSFTKGGPVPTQKFGFYKGHLPELQFRNNLKNLALKCKKCLLIFAIH